MTNWGENSSIQEEGNDHHLTQDEGLYGVEDWLIKRGIEEEARTRDWLLEESNKPIQAKMRQANLEVSRTVLKAGKCEKDEKVKKVTFKYNKKGKLTEKEKVEIKRTSANIFDWFSRKVYFQHLFHRQICTIDS